MLLIVFLVTVLVTAVSLLIISRLPLGIEVDSINKALIAGLVFGLLNALVRPILGLIALPFNLVTLGLFSGLISFILNVVIFALAAKLVEGFRLRWGFWSAVLGAFILSILNSLLGQILSQIFQTAATGS